VILKRVLLTRDSSTKATCQFAAGGNSTGGALTVMSTKFSLIPFLHSRFDFMQLWQTGLCSSHLRCRFLQVKQPVRTLLALLVWMGVSSATSLLSMAEEVDG
jgi:hypothetical protein